MSADELDLEDVAADAIACLHCEDQGHICDWCGEPPGDCYCMDEFDDGDDEEELADRWSRCTWCQEAAA